MRARRSRGGRPRTENRGPDTGTPELQARRLALVGGVGTGADPALSTTPLGRLLALGLITRDEYRGGQAYAWLYRQATGWKPHGAGRIYDGTMVAGLKSVALGVNDAARGGPENERPAAQHRFRAVKNRLLAAGQQVCDATENLAVFELTPGFLATQSDRNIVRSLALRSHQFRSIREGLAILVAAFGTTAAQTGRMEAHRYASLMETPKRARR